jgi:hypothetical protein
MQSPSNLASITEEIKRHQNVERETVFEIGRLLKMVKEEDLTHGEFTKWLSSIGYNARTAQRYMQIYERFHTIEAAKSVSIGNLTELLSLPTDVDVKPFITSAKTEPVKKVREMVKAVKQTEQSRSAKPSTATYSSSPIINKATNALNNLIPEIVACLEAKQLSLDDAVKIGEHPTETQQRLIALGEIDPDDLDIYLFIACYENNVAHAERMIQMLKVINESYGLFSTDLEFVSLVKAVESLANSKHYELFSLRVKELYDKLEEFESRREEKKSQQYNWEDFFNQNNWDNFKSKTTGSTSTVTAPRMLGLQDGASVDEMKAKYRQLMKVLHPDVGGSAYLFDIVKKAYDDFRKEAV